MEGTAHHLHQLNEHLDCHKWGAAPAVITQSALDMPKSSASLHFYLSNKTQIYTCLADTGICVTAGTITALALALSDMRGTVIKSHAQLIQITTCSYSR